VVKRRKTARSVEERLGSIVIVHCYILVAVAMDLRLGDVIDDFCVKCRRVTNHAVVSLMNGTAAKVRCRTCYGDHDYRHEQAPPSKKDLKKAALFNAVLSAAGVPEAPADDVPVDETNAAKKSAKPATD
jgi:hypothetical protein